MKKKIQIYLNSKRANKYINDTTANCIFHLPFIHTPTNKKHSVSISVLSAQIPCSYYNVNENNNKLIYNLNSGEPIDVIIEPSNYNINTLITELKLHMNGFEITYNNMTGKLTFEHHTFIIKFYNESICFELLGFSNKDHVSTFGNTIASDSVINLYTVQMIQIASDNFILDNIDSYTPNNSNILQSLPVTSAFGSIIHYSNLHDLQSDINTTRNLTNLHIMLLNQNDEVIQLNGSHWSIVLLLTIE